MELISSIIGKNPKGVGKVLGSVDKIEFVRIPKFPTCLKASYRKGEIEVMYIDQVADWITITNRQTRIIADFITFFGLPDITTSQHFITTQFKDIAGIREINFFLSTQNEIASISIKAFTILT